jgi:hypothetical protein
VPARVATQKQERNIGPGVMPVTEQ